MKAVILFLLLGKQNSIVLKVYVDNNVLIDYEEGKVALPSNNDIQYQYSYVHIDELIESGERMNSIIKRRFDAINTLTRGHFVQHDENYELESIIVSPQEVFSVCSQPSRIKNMEILREASKNFALGYDRNRLIEKLGINVKELNNYSVEKLSSKYGRVIVDYVISSAITIQEGFQSFFNILDWMGFWRDKYKERSNMARAYDAGHAYFATYCDYFVTNDKRTMNKANVVYQALGYKTVAMSCMDFMKLEDLMLNN